MEHDSMKHSRESGARIWESLASQMAEAGGFFGSMFNSFKSFVKKYFWSLLILALLGGIAGGCMWWLKPAYYKADMTVSYVHYEKKIYADMLDKLNSLLQQDEMSELSDILGMNEEELSEMLYIRSFNIRKEALTEDLSTEKIPFYIEVGVTNPEILPVLQDALVAYLNHTEYIQSRLDFMYRKTDEELQFLERRLSVVDSLSRMIIIRSDNANDEKTITRMELLEESLAIYARIQEVRGMQAFNLNIEVLDGFVAIENKAGMGFMSFLLYGILIGIGLRLLFLVFR
jgi:hypothetical protein